MLSDLEEKEEKVVSLFSNRKLNALFFLLLFLSITSTMAKVIGALEGEKLSLAPT